MNETDWLTGDDPQAMLEHLKRSRRIHRTPAGKRKLRLFLCASFRRLWQLLPDARTRAMVELGEQLADGAVDPETINTVAEAAKAAHWEAVRDVLARVAEHSQVDASSAHLADLIRFAHEPDAWKAARSIAGQIDNLSPGNSAIDSLAGPTVRAHLIRELFGNPYSPTVPDADWLEWHDGIVWKMARTIYNESRFEDLPILADALEDAGCIESDLLDHCRSGDVHARDCWAVDLLLGKG